jgi:signal transduction histidine kinase/DNA-binding response OmpR family regulator
MQAPDHIVVLDDDPGTLALATRRLEHAQFKVTACRTIADARAVIGSEGAGIHLIIADYSLEGDESGLDFLRQLWDANVNVASVLMTGYVTEERILEALRSGVSDVVRKNDGYLELLPSVARRVIDNSRMQKDLLVAEESRRYYHLLSNAIPHLVYTVAVDGTLLYGNAPWNAYTGVDLANTKSLHWIDTMVVPEDHGLTRDAFVRGMSDHGFSVIHRLRSHQHEHRWFATRGVMLRLAGLSESWLLTSTDIDQQYRDARENAALLESERLARAAAESAMLAKDDFIATVSHELRSPLNAVVGWTEVLLRDPALADKQRSGLEVILRNAKSQAKMIDDLLDMSSVLAGRLRLEPQLINLVEIVELALLTVQPQFDAKGIELRRGVMQSGNVKGDSARLQQVLWNLLVNALKFTDKGGHVEVAVQRDARDIVISVADSGRGISADFLPHVFERFKQEPGVEKPKGGLGLGLAITRELVEAHHGRIFARSEGAHQGTCFSVYLPLITQSDADRPAVPLDQILRNMRVLVVEDDQDARDFITANLTSRGALVASAASAREAMTQIYAQRPDLVLSDLGLGEQDGHALMRAIRDYERREHLAPVPAIALTALTQAEDRHRSLEAGFNAHLGKPVDTEELLRTMARLLERSLP